MEQQVTPTFYGERCLGQVRWVNVVGYGKPMLQQAWEVVKMDDNGQPYQAQTEWRDVPFADDLRLT
jgi:hypothetical protein